MAAADYEMAEVDLLQMNELFDEALEGPAAELYEMAMDAGCHQSIINLGYIWEHGRTGERNYEKAFQYYGRGHRGSVARSRAA